MSERLTPAEIDAIEKTWRGVGDFDVVHDNEYGELTLRVEGYGVVARMDCDDDGFVKTAEAWAQGGSTVLALVDALRERDAENECLRSERNRLGAALRSVRDALGPSGDDAMDNGLCSLVSDVRADRAALRVENASLTHACAAALADAARLRAAAVELFDAQANDDSVTEAWLETDEQDRDADAAKDASRVRVASALKELRATIGDAP